MTHIEQWRDRVEESQGIGGAEHHLAVWLACICSAEPGEPSVEAFLALERAPGQLPEAALVWSYGCEALHRMDSDAFRRQVHGTHAMYWLTKLYERCWREEIFKPTAQIFMHWREVARRLEEMTQ